MGNKTLLFENHRALGAKMVNFSGWDMPIHYGSQIEEHHGVRQGAGVFDVSHMTVVEIHGHHVVDFLDRLLANDIRSLKLPGQAMYSAMLNEQGGVIDDLIIYGTGDPFLAVVNCGTRDKDLAWMRQVAAPFDVKIVERSDFAILAVQGPEALARSKQVMSSDKGAVLDGLKVFQGAWVDGWFIARTGYTGERGLEIILPGSDAVSFWESLLAAGVKPIGLGARDTLRLEAGMNLYGSDMDESVSPLESNMAGTVHLEGREFIGAEAIRQQQAAGRYNKLVGLVMTARGVLRAHYPVFSEGRQVGEITSGAFSPTLQHAIALARVSESSTDMSVEIRGKMQPVECVEPPFVRNGSRVYKTR